MDRAAFLWPTKLGSERRSSPALSLGIGDASISLPEILMERRDFLARTAAVASAGVGLGPKPTPAEATAAVRARKSRRSMSISGKEMLASPIPNDSAGDDRLSEPNFVGHKKAARSIPVGQRTQSRVGCG